MGRRRARGLSRPPSSSKGDDLTIAERRALAAAAEPRKWTGKSPVQLLNEYAQKHKLPRPKLVQMQSPGNTSKFKCLVYPSATDKHREIACYIPKEASENGTEARHCAAVVALHGLCGHTSLHRVMDIPYRELWLKLDKEVADRRKAQSKRGRGASKGGRGTSESSGSSRGAATSSSSTRGSSSSANPPTSTVSATTGGATTTTAASNTSSSSDHSRGGRGGNSSRGGRGGGRGRGGRRGGYNKQPRRGSAAALAASSTVKRSSSGAIIKPAPQPVAKSDRNKIHRNRLWDSAQVQSIFMTERARLRIDANIKDGADVFGTSGDNELEERTVYRLRPETIDRLRGEYVDKRDFDRAWVERAIMALVRVVETRDVLGPSASSLRRAPTGDASMELDDDGDYADVIEDDDIEDAEVDVIEREDAFEDCSRAIFDWLLLHCPENLLPHKHRSSLAGQMEVQAPRKFRENNSNSSSDPSLKRDEQVESLMAKVGEEGTRAVDLLATFGFDSVSLASRASTLSKDACDRATLYDWVAALVSTDDASSVRNVHQYASDEWRETRGEFLNEEIEALSAILGVDFEWARRTDVPADVAAIADPDCEPEPELLAREFVELHIALRSEVSHDTIVGVVHVLFPPELDYPTRAPIITCHPAGSRPGGDGEAVEVAELTCENVARFALTTSADYLGGPLVYSVLLDLQSQWRRLASARPIASPGGSGADRSSEKTVSGTSASGNTTANRRQSGNTRTGSTTNNHNSSNTSSRKKNRGRRQYSNSVSRAVPVDPAKGHLNLSNDQRKRLRAQQERLPGYQQRETLWKIVEKHRVVVVSGATGCGKSTQVPQMLLDYMKPTNRESIICTQPRRIAAVSLAERVARERGEKVGFDVGYRIRLEKRTSEHTRLAFVTTGILLRQLQSNVTLNGVDCIVVDEVHERSLDSDFLLILLRQLMRRNKHLKLILMSATLDANLFQEYFGADTPCFDIPGRSFPVNRSYLENSLHRLAKSGQLKTLSSYRSPPPRESMSDKDRDELDRREERIRLSFPHLHNDAVSYLLHCYKESTLDTELVALAASDILSKETQADGSMLIFASGLEAIVNIINALRRRLGGSALLLPLHGSLTPVEQQRVFERPPAGKRKIVVATNIAETSITIDDVTMVVDTGRMKQTQFDSLGNTSSLVEVWESKANATQRAGRAGRVREGSCVHIFSAFRHQDMLEREVSEMKRSPLEYLCMQIKLLDLGNIHHILSQALEPPESDAVQASVDRLTTLQVFEKVDPPKHKGRGKGKSPDTGGSNDTTHVRLTALGQHLARMPVDVAIGKMLIYGALFQCVDPILSIAACLSYRSPFVAPLAKREEANVAKQRMALFKSDHLTMMRAYRGWERARLQGRHAEREYCEENFLSIATLYTIKATRRELRRMLVDLGFLDSVKSGNAESTNLKLIQAVVCAGLYPNIVQVVVPPQRYVQTHAGSLPKDHDSFALKFRTEDRSRVFVHPSSVNFKQGNYEYLWLAFREKARTTKLWIRDCSMMPPYAMLLFGGSLEVVHEHAGIVVDGWIRYHAPARIAILVKHIRSRLDTMLQAKIEDPRLDLSRSPLLHTIVDVITADGLL